jgi:hypothetical protein
MTEMNQAAWEKTIQEDMDWLIKNTPDQFNLEYRHIVDCLKWLKDHKPDGKEL